MNAGWIKLNSSFLTSPEVKRLARILEDDRETCASLSTGYMGVLGEIVTFRAMRYIVAAGLVCVFTEASALSDDGVMLEMSRQDIDELTGISGFACAMEDEGLAVFLEDPPRAQITGFEKFSLKEVK